MKPYLPLVCPLGLLLLTSIFSISCVYQQNQGVPSWLIHVPPGNINPNTQLEPAKKRIIYELKQPHLPQNYIRPEQYAGFAIQQIKNNQLLDASIMLAIASYTYQRQGILAYETGKQNAARDLRYANQNGVDMYHEFLSDEISTFRSLELDDYVLLSISLWEKKKRVFEQLESDLKQYHDALRPQETERQRVLKTTIQTKLETARTPSWDKLAYPEIAAAFLERLSDDITRPEYKFDAVFYLSAIPLEPFLKKALSNTPVPFVGVLFSNINARFASYEHAVINALKSPVAMTRSNAALILASRDEPKYLPLLEETYSKETDQRTKWSLEFSLVTNGKTELLPSLLQKSAYATDEDYINHLILLFTNLSDESLKEVNQNWLIQIAKTESHPSYLRAKACDALGTIGEVGTVSNNVVHALLTLSDSEIDNLASAATFAIYRLKQLDAKAIRQLLSQKTAGYPAILLRMSAITDKSNFEFWKTQVSFFPSHTYGSRVSVVYGVSKTKHPEAPGILKQLYHAHPDLRLHIASAYSSLSQVSKSDLISLAQLDSSPASCYLYFAAKNRTRGANQLLGIFNNGTFEQRLQATQVAKTFMTRKLKPAIWKSATYFDSRYYPNDAYLRNAAVSTLLIINMQEQFKRIEYEAQSNEATKAN